jgi:hypothetical protein
MTSLKDENQMMVCKKEKRRGATVVTFGQNGFTMCSTVQMDDRIDLGMCSTAHWTMVLTLLYCVVRGTLVSTVLYCPVDNRTNCREQRPMRSAASMDMLR